MKKNRSNSVECLKKTFAWKKHSLPLIFLATFFPSAAYSAIYYVDNSGSPACSDSPSYSSEAKPWCTIEYGSNRLVAGDTMYVKNGSGNYNEAIDTLNIKGTALNPITIKAYPGHTPKIDRNSYGSGVGWYLEGCSYVIIDGFEIMRSQNAVRIYECDHITVQNCKIHGSGNETVRVHAGGLNASTYITFNSNQVYDSMNGGSNGECFYIGSAEDGANADYTNNVTISNNTIYDCAEEAIEIKRGSHHQIVDGNTIYSSTSGYAYATAGNVTLNRNGPYSGNPQHIVRNNTIHTHGNANGGAIWTDTGSTIYNNVIYGCSRGIYVINDSGDSYTRYIYHNTIDVTSARAVVISSGTTDVKNNIGPSTTNNMITSNAYYVNKAGANYHLVAGSAPINAGLNLTSTVPTDIEGNSRSANPPPDLGAYEYIGNDTTPPTPPQNLRIN